MSWKIKLTSQRVVITCGLFSRRVEEVEYYRVRDTQYKQKIIQRLFNTGTITLISDDATSPKLSFHFMNPKNYWEQIRESVRIQRQEMRAIQTD
jgi:hypothetical protein